MIALSLALAAFAAWWLIGLAVLAVARADTTDLRIALTAPVLGTAVTVLALFVVSHAGAGMTDGAPPVVGVLLFAASVIVIARRPRVPRGAWPVIALCLIDLVFVGRPMFAFGLDWIANANDDMANYVLSATDLLHHGLRGPVDIVGLSHDRDYPSLLRTLHDQGSRPGADITLAAFSSSVRRPPYELFMPLILALNMCTICGAAALAMQAARRWWAASVAALLFAASPLATYGVLAQLMPQVWGLGLAAALFAVLMRDDLYRRRAAASELAAVAFLVCALVVVYVELAAAVSAAYVLYIVVLIVQRRVNWRAVAPLWGIAMLAMLALLNSYLFRELHYVASQASGGVKGGVGFARLFGFTLVPSALAVLMGLAVQNPSPNTRFMSEAILIAIGLCSGVAVGALLTLRRRVASSLVLLTYLALGVFLGLRSSDFGLFKLYMYVQPFLAAAAAVWLSYIKRRSVLVLAGVALALLVAVQVRTANHYVQASRNPVDLPHASERDLLPTFRRWFAAERSPVISTTENPVLGKLEAVSTHGRPLLFVAKNLFLNFASATEMGWTSHSILTQAAQGRSRDTFLQNPRANLVLANGPCLIVLPTGSQTPLNRYQLPEGSPDLAERRCGHAQNLLVFTSSSLGQGFFLPKNRRRVSFYQLEPDYFYPGHTFAGFGRFVLFRVLDPSLSFRLELDVTTTVRQDGSNVLPQADIVGTKRRLLPLVGRGSARVFSAPLRPQLIAGQPFLLLDMGVEGRLNPYPRSGIEALYGRSVSVDPRFLTSYVRDISVVSDAQYRDLRSPLALSHFPGDLADPNLEYSGVYEDGWVAENSYVTLAGGRASHLVVRADVLQIPHQHLAVFVNGRRVASRAVEAGPLELRIAVPGSASRRRVELRWSHTVPLGSSDHRPAAAHLRFVGLVPSPRTDLKRTVQRASLDQDAAGFISSSAASRSAAASAWMASSRFSSSITVSRSDPTNARSSATSMTLTASADAHSSTSGSARSRTRSWKKTRFPIEPVGIVASSHWRIVSSPR